MLGSRGSVADHYERLKRDRLSAAKRQRSLAVRIAKSIQGAAEQRRARRRPDELLGFPQLGCEHSWRSWKPRTYGAAMSAWPIVTLLRNNVQVATVRAMPFDPS